MIKLALSQDVDQAAFQTFHNLCATLPLNKNEVMALMITTFNALPPGVQDRLCSKRTGVAEASLEKLSRLDDPPDLDHLVQDAVTGAESARRNQDTPARGHDCDKRSHDKRA